MLEATVEEKQSKSEKIYVSSSHSMSENYFWLIKVRNMEQVIMSYLKTEVDLAEFQKYFPGYLRKWQISSQFTEFTYLFLKLSE
jgi:hypothetical protein